MVIAEVPIGSSRLCLERRCPGPRRGLQPYEVDRLPGWGQGFDFIWRAFMLGPRGWQSSGPHGLKIDLPGPQTHNVALFRLCRKSPAPFSV